MVFLGDDVMQDDPTVKLLEEDAARITGKEAALFVTSGTMGNLLAVISHCQLGDEVILGEISHVFLYEAAGMSAVGGVMPHCVPVQIDGTLKLEDIKQAIREKDDHHPITRLVILENTHNRRGGVPLPKSYVDSVGDFVHSKGLKLHIDGARIFNAAVALKVDVKDLVASADSITFALSKGLCAPVGSVLCGSKEFIGKARHRRKMLGGGLRQAGVLAAAGIIGLHKMSKRIHEDHQVTQMLNQGIKDIPGYKVLTCYTNFLWFELTLPISTETFSKELQDVNILLPPYIGRRYRCAFHYWITPENTQTIIDALKHISQKYHTSSRL